MTEALTIVAQQIHFDEHGQYLTTKWSNGAISSMPVTSEEASEWEARNRY